MTYRLRPVHQLVEAEQFTREQAEYAMFYDNKTASERVAEGLKAPEFPRGVSVVHGRFMLDVPGTADDVAMQIGDYVLRDCVTGDLHSTPVMHAEDFCAMYEPLQALPKAEEVGSAVDAVEALEGEPTRVTRRYGGKAK